VLHHAGHGNPNCQARRTHGLGRTDEQIEQLDRLREPAFPLAGARHGIRTIV
jgi:hypothetical protein